MSSATRTKEEVQYSQRPSILPIQRVRKHEQDTTDVTINIHRYSSRRGTLIRQPLDRIPPPDDIHEWDPRDLAYASSELAIARRDDVAFVRRHTLDEAVVRVRARMRARQPLEPRISRDSVIACTSYTSEHCSRARIHGEDQGREGDTYLSATR